MAQRILPHQYVEGKWLFLAWHLYGSLPQPLYPPPGLRAYAIMANHAHTLRLPKIAPQGLLQSLKGAAAREVNAILGRTGQPFWQPESTGHWVRDEREMERIIAYSENPGTSACATLS
jgi:hypothetical protein